MAVNKNALIRYKTIDKCLQNKQRKWTLDNLIERCSDALYEYEGKDCNVSKRTVQLDIYNMRSDKLGYNAPIIVVDKKYYTYEDKNYSITNLPISSNDLEKLAESVTFLKQFKGFSHFDALNGVIQKLEDHVYSKQTSTNPVIEFEKNEHLKGLSFLDDLYQTIIHKKTIEITYKSFKARQATTFCFHAYLLKEYRNRWFLIGIREKQEHLVNLALDRILTLKDSEIIYKHNTKYDLENYFSKAIGVSVNPNLKTEEIVLFVYNRHAPYIITKPFHPTQKVIAKNIFGITISLDVQHNFELEKEILGLGDGIRVISPNNLKRRIKERLIYAVDSYQTEINDKMLVTMKKQFYRKGASIINQIFSMREIKKIHQDFYRFEKSENIKIAILSDVLTKIPSLEKLIFNENLQKTIQQINTNLKLIHCIFYKKTSNTNKEWFQNGINDGFSIRIHLKETTKINRMDIILGSHNKEFNKQEIELLVKNSIAHQSQVRQGGIQIIHNQLLRKWFSTKQSPNCDVIELIYGN